MSAASLITPDALADQWGVPKSHVYRLAREGVLPCVRLGKYVRFDPEEIARFIETGGTKEAKR